MKEHAKKALKHDISVAGKTIPTMIIIGLFLVGGGSAALLTSFGTVSGDASVDQAITIGEETFAEDQAEATFSFDDETTVAGETFVDTETINNNANVSANYKFVTEGTELGIDSQIYRLDSEQHNLEVTQSPSSNEEWEEDSTQATLTKDYNSSENQIVLSMKPTELAYNTNQQSQGEQAINKGFVFDSDRDGSVDFQVYHYDGTWGYQPYNGETWGTEITDTNEFPEWISVSIGEDDTTYNVSVDADVTGGTFRYAARAGEHGTAVKVASEGFSWTDSSEFPTAQIGPKVGTGAATDLEEGTVTRTYQNGEVTFRFSDPESSPVLGIDTKSDGNWDLQFAYNNAGLDLWNGGSDGDWTHYGEYKDPDEHGLSGNPHWETSEGDDIEAPEGVSISGGKHTDYVAITIDSSRLDDTFRYDVGQNGDVFSGKDEGDSSQAEVVTIGVESLDSEESQDYVFVNDFAINLEEDDYTVSTDVVPVTE